jgi:hypothetical protein
MGLHDIHLRARLTQPGCELWDRRLGVHTFGHHPGTGGPGDREWYMHYIPSSYRDVFAVLRRAGIAADDVVTDVGSGLGRVAFAAAWAGAGKVEGVELIGGLVERAEANRRGSRLSARDIRFTANDARQHDYGATTLLYMFHPFGHEIVAEMLEKVRRDREAARERRALRIAYVNPVADEVLQASGWLEKVETIPATPQRWSSADHYLTSIWRSVD